MNNQSQIMSFRTAAVICPVLAIGLFQSVANEPMQANAEESHIEFLALPVVPEWSVLEEKAELSTKHASSPFWFEDIELQMPEFPPLERPEVRIVKEPDPIFKLSAVLPSARNSLAVINGKAFSQGDQIMEDWILHRIIGKDRYVILMHSSGRRVRVQMTQN